MPRPRVYVETSIPSAYFDERTQPEMVRRRENTRRWWVKALGRYELWTSGPVHEELKAGPSDRVPAWIDLILDLPLLDVSPPVIAIADTYVRHKLMPGGGNADAYHLALASYYRCELLVTWDLKHLANPNKFRHIQKVNGMLGLSVPQIVTPLQLLRGDHE